MTSRERVYASLDGKLKGRVPRHLWTLPWAERNHGEKLREIRERFPNDIVSAPVSYKTPTRESGDPYEEGIYRDEWGCTFRNIQAGVIGEVKFPLIESLDDLSPLRAPEELLTFDIDKINDFCARTDSFVIQPTCARPFERLQFLRSSQNLYIDLAELSMSEEEHEADRPGGLTTLLDTIHDFYKRELTRWAQTDVDALFFMDDWGSQKALLISPDLWRKLFKPLYREYIDIAHKAGKRIFMHSDGYIVDIIPDLIELGLDALNSQIFCMGIERLAKFKGKICFWGEIDRQHLLAEATVDEVKHAVEQVKDHLFEDGGIIAQCEFGPGARPENVRAVLQKWDELTSLQK